MDDFTPFTLRKRSKSRDGGQPVLMTTCKSPKGYVYIPRSSNNIHTQPVMHAYVSASLPRDARNYNSKARIKAKKKEVTGSNWSLATPTSQTNTLYRPNQDRAVTGHVVSPSQNLRRSQSIPDFRSEPFSNPFMPEASMEPSDNRSYKSRNDGSQISQSAIIHRGTVITIQVPSYDEYDTNHVNDFDDDFLSDFSSDYNGNDIYDEIMQAMAPYQQGSLVRNKFRSEPMLNQASSPTFPSPRSKSPIQYQRQKTAPIRFDFETDSVLSHTSSRRSGLESEVDSRIVVLTPGRRGFGFTLCCVKGGGGGNPYFDTIADGSIAKKGGLKAGDIILEINGENVQNASLYRCVELIKSDDAVTLRVVTPASSMSSLSGRGRRSRTEQYRPESRTSNDHHRHRSKSPTASLSSHGGMSFANDTIRSTSSHQGTATRGRPRIFSEPLQAITTPLSPIQLDLSTGSLISPSSPRNDHIYDVLDDVDVPKPKPKPRKLENTVVTTKAVMDHKQNKKHVSDQENSIRLVQELKRMERKPNDSQASLSSNESISSEQNFKSPPGQSKGGKNGPTSYKSQQSAESGYGTVSSNNSDNSMEGMSCLRDAIKDSKIQSQGQSQGYFQRQGQTQGQSHIQEMLREGPTPIYDAQSYASELPNDSKINNYSHTAELPFLPVNNSVAKKPEAKPRGSGPPPVAARQPRSQSSSALTSATVNSGRETLLPTPKSKPVQVVPPKVQGGRKNNESSISVLKENDHTKPENVKDLYRRSMSENNADFDIYSNIDELVAETRKPPSNIRGTSANSSVYSSGYDFMEQANTLLKKYTEDKQITNLPSVSAVNETQRKPSAIPQPITRHKVVTPPVEEKKLDENSDSNLPSFRDEIRLAAETFSKRSGKIWTEFGPDADTDDKKAYPTGVVKGKRTSNRTPVSLLAEIMAASNMKKQNDSDSNKVNNVNNDIGKSNETGVLSQFVAASKEATVAASLTSPAASATPSASDAASAATRSPAARSPAARSPPAKSPVAASTSNEEASPATAAYERQQVRNEGRSRVKKPPVHPRSKSASHPEEEARKQQQSSKSSESQNNSDIKLTKEENTRGRNNKASIKNNASGQGQGNNAPVLRKITKSHSKDIREQLRLSMNSLNAIDENPNMILPPSEFGGENNNEVFEASTNFSSSSPSTGKDPSLSGATPTARSRSRGRVPASEGSNAADSAGSRGGDTLRSLFNKTNGKEVSLWSVDEVLDWLRLVDLGEYCDNFQRKKISGDMLGTLDRQGLINLGMNSVEHRRDFERALRKVSHK